MVHQTYICCNLFYNVQWLVMGRWICYRVTSMPMQRHTSSAYDLKASFVTCVSCPHLPLLAMIPLLFVPPLLSHQQNITWVTQLSIFPISTINVHLFLLHIVKYFQGTNEEARVFSPVMQDWHTECNHTNSSLDLLNFYALPVESL
jgi:hypothetical protein